MKAEELLAPFRVWLHWCKGIKASWECLLIKSWRIFQRDFKSKIPILLHIYVFFFICICALLMYMYFPPAVCSAAWPAPGQPVWFPAGWAALAHRSGSPVNPATPRGHREWERWALMNGTTDPQYSKGRNVSFHSSVLLFSPLVFHGFHFYHLYWPGRALSIHQPSAREGKRTFKLAQIPIRWTSNSSLIKLGGWSWMKTMPCSIQHFKGSLLNQK